ncbi:MAG: hypothetical protein WD080_04105 [Egibacteraceae bacterium]
MRPAARILLVATLALTVLVSAALPALAHGRGSDATNYDSHVTEVPDIEDVQWRVYGGDEVLWVDNRSGEEIVVEGYADEPYLRIGPDGVWENGNSPATYVNRERFGQVPVPESADPDASPDWVQVSDQPRFAWHDHRIHFMGTGLHPRVTDVGARTQLQEWGVPVSVDGRDMEVLGELVWVPGPPWWPWLLVGLALALPALIGLRTQPAEGRWPGLAKPAAAVLWVVVAANAVFLVDALFAVPLPLLSQLFAALQTALFIGLGVFGAWRGWQAREGAFTALGVGSGALFVGQGLLLWSVLGASQLSTVFPDVVPRLVTGLNIAQVVPLGVVAFLGTQRLLPDLDEADEGQEPVDATS